MSNDTSDNAPIQIIMKHGYSAIVDQIDSDLANRKWHPKIQRKSVHAKDSKNNYLHRLIFERIIGRPLIKGEMVDHIDQNGLNCVRANLRLTDMTGNVRNRDKQANNTSGYKGITKSGSKWLARIGVNGAKILIGAYVNLHDAARAYNEAALIHHGEFACLNVIEE